MNNITLTTDTKKISYDFEETEETFLELIELFHNSFVNYNEDEKEPETIDEKLENVLIWFIQFIYEKGSLSFYESEKVKLQIIVEEKYDKRRITKPKKSIIGEPTNVESQAVRLAKLTPRSTKSN